MGSIATMLAQPRILDEPEDARNIRTLILLWEGTVLRNVHQSRKGKWHGRDAAGYPIPGKHIYDPAFLKWLRRWQHEPIVQLLDPDHRAWRKGQAVTCAAALELVYRLRGGRVTVGAHVLALHQARPRRCPAHRVRS
jgi:hypothetical protein